MNEQTFALLVSIDTTLKAMLALAQQRTARASGAASNADLDSPRGNPKVNAKDPRDWTGEPMKGRLYSQCPPEYLDLLAKRFDFFNTTEIDDKKKSYNANDAARARGWAARLRAGWTPPEPVAETSGEPSW